MIDLFALVLSHALLALAAWRLVMRGDLDRDPPEAEGTHGDAGGSRRG